LQAVGIDHAPEEFPRAEEMPLPDELFRRARPHAHRQRRLSAYLARFAFIEKAHGGGIIARRPKGSRTVCAAATG